MKLSLKNTLTGSYLRVPKNLAGHKVILKLSPTKSDNQPAQVEVVSEEKVATSSQSTLVVEVNHLRPE
jgi:hypothetical protein